MHPTMLSPSLIVLSNEACHTCGSAHSRLWFKRTISTINHKHSITHPSIYTPDTSTVSLKPSQNFIRKVQFKTHFNNQTTINMVNPQFFDENNKFIDMYEALAVTKSATSSDIDKSFRKLAISIHPDKNKSPGAVRKFKSLSNYRDILNDPTLRQEYDRAYLEAKTGEKLNDQSPDSRDDTPPSFRRSKVYTSQSGNFTYGPLPPGYQSSYVPEFDDFDNSEYEMGPHDYSPDCVCQRCAKVRCDERANARFRSGPMPSFGGFENQWDRSGSSERCYCEACLNARWAYDQAYMNRPRARPQSQHRNDGRGERRAAPKREGGS